MIIVSTMSEPEALAAANALNEALADHLGFEVYLRGSRFYGRETRPAIAPDELLGMPEDRR